MRVKFWGVRGSIPSPQITKEYRSKLKEIISKIDKKELKDNKEIDTFIEKLPFYLKNNYGGNTTCIEINDDKENVFILDAGTGIRLLGNHYIKDNKVKNFHIFFTHFHWDHIQGFPFFIPAYMEDINITFYSTKKNFKNILFTQQNKHTFPKRISEMKCKIKFITLESNKSIKIDNTIVDTFALNHPGGVTAYRFTNNNKKVIFSGDVEFTQDDIYKINDYGTFFNEADIAIFDSQYTLEEAFYRFDWGHSSYSMAVNLAVNWEIKKLILTHFDPTYDDKKISSLEKEAIEHVDNIGDYKLKVQAAYEGLILEL